MSDKEHVSDADIAGGEADFEDAIEGEVVSESGQRRTLNRLPLILAALALACSTRLDTIPTLAVCSAFFLVGMMSDYFYSLAGGKLGGALPI